MDAPEITLVSSLNNIELSFSPPRTRAALHTGQAVTWEQKYSAFLDKLWIIIYRESSPFVSPTRDQFNDDGSEKIVTPVKMKSLISMSDEEFRTYQSLIRVKFSFFEANSKLKGHQKSFADRLLEIYIVSESKRAFRKLSNRLRPEDIDETALNNVYEHFDGKCDDILFLKKEYSNFLHSYKKAENTAMKLHVRFKFLYPNTEVVVDPETNKTTLTYEQLQVAVKMARDNFPQLLDCMWHEHFIPKVTRLIQIIVAGEKVINCPLPIRPTIFELKELQGVQSSPKLREIANNCSFLFHHVFNFENTEDTRVLNDLSKEEAKARLETIIGQFVNDNIIRTGNRLKINGKTIDLGGSMIDASPFATIKDAYITFLRNTTPEKIQETIQLAKESSLLRAVRSAFEKDDLGWFSVSTFLNMFEKEIKYRSGVNQNECAELLKTIANNSQIDLIIYADVFSKVELKTDLEDLLRYFFLAFIVTCNQNIQGVPTTHFGNQIREMNPMFWPTMAAERVFELTGNPAGTFASKGIMIAKTLQEVVNADGPVESFQNQIELFQSETIFRVCSLMGTSYKTTEDHPVTIALNNLQFNWKLPKKYIDIVFNILHAKPRATLTQEPALNSLLDLLTEIGDQREGDSLIILRDSTIKINQAVERLTLSQRVSGGNPYLMMSVTSLDAKQNAIELLAHQTESAVRDYIIYTSLKGESSEVVEEKLAEVVKRVIRAQAGLVNIGDSETCFSRLIKTLAA